MPARPLGRLRKGREFDSAYSEGTVFNGPLCVVRARPNDLGLERYGFAVGKKLAPSSVVRNRTRRRLREAVREVRAGTKPRGADVIITAKSRLLGASYPDLMRELGRQLERAMSLQVTK